MLASIIAAGQVLLDQGALARAQAVMAPARVQARGRGLVLPVQVALAAGLVAAGVKRLEAAQRRDQVAVQGAAALAIPEAVQVPPVLRAAPEMAAAQALALEAVQVMEAEVLVV